MSGSDTNIDVGITVDTGGVESGMQNASQEVESGAEHMKEAIEGVSEAFKLAAEVFGIGFSIEWAEEIVLHAAEAAEQVDHLTQSLGMSAENIQTMSFAAGLVGANMDTATMAMTRLERAGEQAIAGSKQQEEAFRSIGISSTELADLLKNPDEMIQTVAEDLSGFGNGAAKTAVVMQLFGRNAAQMIPLLNELGNNFDELKDKGEQFGVVLSKDDQQSLFQTSESINALKEAAVGLGNEFAAALAPAIRAVVDGLTALATSDFVRTTFTNLKTDIAELVVISGQFKEAMMNSAVQIGAFFNELLAEFPSLQESFHNAFGGARQDAAQFVADSMSEIDTLITWVKNGALYIQLAFQESWSSIQNGFGSMLSWIEEKISDLAQKEESMLANVPLTGVWKKQLDDLSTSMMSLSSSFSPVITDVEALRDQISQNNAGLENAKKENDAWAQSIRDTVEAQKSHGSELDSTGQKILDYNAKVKNVTDTTVQLTNELVKWEEENDKLLANQDPVTKALLGFDNEMLKSSQELIVLISHGLDYAAALNMLMERSDAATAAEQRSISSAYAKADVLDKLVQKYMDQDQAASAYTNAAKAQVEVDQAIQKEITSLIDKYGAENDFVKAVTQNMLDNRDAAIANLTAFKDHTEGVKLDEAAMKEWATIAQNAFDSSFQAINKDIIEGGSIMTDLVNVAKTVVEEILLQFEKLAIINPILNAIFGGQGGFSLLPTLANSALGSLGGGSSLLSGAGSLLGGSNGLLGNLFGNSGISSLLGSTSGAGSGLMGMLFGGSGSFDMLANAGNDVGMLGTAGLGLDNGVQGTSGLLGSFGDVGSGLGSLASVFGGAMAGYQLGGGVGALGLGALSYAFPVVGWIAGAASLINSLTGGDLFGTSAKPTGVSFEGLNLGQSGFQYNDAIQTHAKGALFSGGSWSQQSEPITADQLSSEQAMTTAMQTTLTNAASALGTTVGTLITGSFSEQLSSSGAVSSNLSTILGKTYTDTIQQFAERVTADNLLALLPAAQNALTIANQWQSSADTLLAGTEMLVQAQTDINKGNSLLGSDKSLSDIADVVQKLTQSGETLLQTYARLQTEQMDLTQNLTELGMTTGKTGADFVTFADQLTQAAGGISNLNSAWATYYGEYYSASEQQANTMKQLQATVTSTFAAIGESSTESMAQFRADFTKSLPTLTPDQVVQWLAAADALAKLTAANQTLAQAAQQATAAQQAAAAAQEAAQLKYSQFVAQFDPATLAMTSFESSLANLDTTMESNMDQANSLAKAAGLAGTSQQDMANIIQDSAEKGVAALKAFEAQAQQLANTLYGTNVQQLTTQLTALQAQFTTAQQNQNYEQELILTPQINAIQGQITAANAQAQAVQRLTDATTLLQDLSQIGSVTGSSLQDLASQMSIPLDQFAKDLGMTPAQLDKQFQQGELQMQAALKANDYLQEILNVLQGNAAGNPTQAPPFPVGHLLNPRVHDVMPDAISAIEKVVNSVDKLTATVAQQANPLNDIARTNRQVADVTTRSAMAIPIGNRNTSNRRAEYSVP